MIERITYLLIMVSLALLPLVGTMSIDNSDSNILQYNTIADDVIKEAQNEINLNDPEVKEAYEKYKESYGYASYALEVALDTEKNDKTEIKFEAYTPDTQLTEDETEKIQDSESTKKDSSLDGLVGGSGIGSGGGSGKGSGDGTGGDLGKHYYIVPDDDDDDSPHFSESEDFKGNVIFVDGDDDDDDPPGPGGRVNEVGISQTKTTVTAK